MFMLNRVLSILMLIVFLFGTTGVTVLQHVCSIGQTRDITAINGITTETTGSCCCSQDQDCPDEDIPDDRQVISAQPCCSEITTLVKFDFVTVNSNELFFTPLTDGFICFVTMLVVNPPLKIDISNDPFFQFHSPPLTGNNLLLAIHQIKIPSLPLF
jgi:hypothetical protein